MNDLLETADPQPMLECQYCGFVGNEDEVFTKYTGDESATICESCYESMF